MMTAYRPPESIDEYIAGFPRDVRAILEQLRAAIREAAPDSEEAIKYRMPTFILNENLVHFAAFKNHIGFYPTPTGIEKFKDELSSYKSAKGSVQFPLYSPMPLPLVKKIVRFRVKEAKANATTRKKMLGMQSNRRRLIVIVAAALAMCAWSGGQAQLERNPQSDSTAADDDSAARSPHARATSQSAADCDQYWPQWRGPRGTGVAPHADPPVEWSETKNLRWKIALPGKGHSTPIVWDNRIFLTTAVPFGEASEPRFSGEPGAHDEHPVTQRHKFMVVAVDRRSGKLLWQRTAREELPDAGGHYTASLASNSPVADGEHLFAFFGSFGLYCLVHDGKLKWQVDLGRMHTLHGHGEGSSPTLARDTLLINWDHEGASFLAAFDKRTGRERWRTPRQAGSSWTTPIVVEQNGQAQVIVSGSQRLRGYDLASGKMLWECGGLSVENVVASPVAGRGIVYAGCSYDKKALLAIRFGGAKGDITGSDRVVWSRSRGTPYVPSLLLYGDALYFHTHYQGVLNRVNARTGEDEPGAIRLRGIRSVFSSPVGAADRVYVSGREGTTVVLSHEARPRILAVNHLDDSFSASAAVVGRELYLRGEQYLYCLASP